MTSANLWRAEQRVNWLPTVRSHIAGEIVSVSVDILVA